MAQFASDPLVPSQIPKPSDPLVDLDRLLGRLQQTILRADAERERRLRTSELEREKATVNIDYARLLLTRLQQDALGIKVHARRQEIQADLNRKRDLLEQVTERVRDLEELSAHAIDDDDDSSSEQDDILSEIIATPSQSLESRSEHIREQEPGKSGLEHSISQAAPSTEPRQDGGNGRVVETLEEVISEKPNTLTSNTIRPRGQQPSDPEKANKDLDTAQTTGAITQKSLLLGDRSTEVSDVSTKEAILDRERREQEELTEAMSKITKELKMSSLRFSEALEEDKEMTEQAAKGLSRNELGLEAAARRMGALTRMTEGKGWWGRIILYAWIYGLMVVLVLVVFVLPKLRF
ncbi:hypothetical protein KVR01_004462 [Diaporthe batatas]|uniref:uncharacterized protein n=1 Tax=Diaporthe batatas TaxID=748121 RepID=UPI001D041761|nr:uncharacterized protein KVR01_004462 [Diaporthe batatas]KAG8165910.1 hypothetical protein KVR01_004462 [Diaporthe batatas]